ncbi:MAG TPA: hypothetical protein VHC69_11400 [Polyangiaceae bacterium]|nr:hypothetical protein [Polyangiaceae bacterium]
MLREKSFVRFALAAALCSAGCTQTTQPVVLRSLEASGRFSSLCLGSRDDTTSTYPLWEPRNLQDCPDTSFADGEDRHAFSMVTQTTRGEVALVDLTLELVSDSEPTIPGYNFVTVGAQPTGIVSTPGSLATFVGVAEPGKEGIFALPTSCVVPRQTNAPLRDLTTWPACRLPSAPGELALVIDAPPDDSNPDVYRQTCSGDTTPTTPAPQSATDANGNPRECPADLSQETQQPGRRKILVSLPERKSIAVIDAQDLLDRPAGEYAPCVFDEEIRLGSYKPDPNHPITQVEPADLKALGGMVTGLAHPQPPDEFEPSLGGFAQIEDTTTKEHRLFVADLNAPVIHEVDTGDVCAPKETDFLYPVAFGDPGRIVTTTRLAASPLTIPPGDQPVTAGNRYLYAIDQFVGSVMMFDVSPGSTNRTPLLRTHAALLPFEQPDRLDFGSPARDVAFALRDHVQVDPATGSQRFGQFCNPDPSISPLDPGALYRPAADLSTGASPSFLRGVFGFAALDNGHVAVVDVQDFDAPCRRPIYPNPGPDEDFRGCANDVVPKSKGGLYQTTALVPTVTDEVSCNVVETNRERSAAAIRNDVTLGVHAPSLITFPTLVSDQGRSLPTNGTPDGLKNPRMLGVDFSAKDKAQVWLGTTLYAAGDRSNPLLIDPAQADSASLVLSFQEPRIYAPQETFSAIYEGITSGPHTSGNLTLYADAYMKLKDSGASFCDEGVQDEPVAQQRGPLYQVADDDLPTFGLQHADYVEITSDLFPSDDDVYWTKGHAGASCGEADPNTPGAGFLACQTAFGTAANPNTKRQFHVIHASKSELLLKPRSGANAKLVELTACCFPSDISYVVRASREWVVRGSVSGSPTDEETTTLMPYPLTTPPWVPPDNTACSLNQGQDPLKKFLRSRALEVSCKGTDCAPNSGGQATVGPADSKEVACVFAPGQLPDPVLTNAADDWCIYNGLNSAFIIYKGTTSSVQKYEYDWTVTGGFSPLSINLSATTDTNTSPLAMIYSPARDALLVADGSTKGIVTVDLNTLAITVIY